jgi:hypothetical protein
MSRFIGDMSRDLGLDPDDPFAHIDELNTEPQLKDFSKLLAKCYLKRSQWMVELDPNWAMVGSWIPKLARLCQITIFRGSRT